MSLIDALRHGVETINTITKTGGLQGIVLLERFTGESGLGESTYSNPIKLDALIDWKQKQVRTKDGILSVSRAGITFVNVTQLAKATNNQGIDDNDRITLPDGTSGPILDMDGFIDPGTKQPLATTIYLG